MVHMIDHLGIPVSDFEVSVKFYEAIFPSLGYRKGMSHGSAQQFASQSDSVWISQADSATQPTPRHIAFKVSSVEGIQEFYDAGLASGGTDNGAPGPRSYREGYYAAFVLDPDGNNIEAVLDNSQN